MVREFTVKRKQRSYNLLQLQQLAAADSIIYASTRKILEDLDRLNLSERDLQNCIGGLTDQDFQHSVRYKIDGSSPMRYTHWMDVYRLRGLYCPKDESYEGSKQIDLYVKLSLSNNCLCVQIQSFHEWGKSS